MKAVPLKLGELKAEGLVIRRSPIHWLCEDGHLCRPSEVVGFCTISMEVALNQRGSNIPMTDELDFQVAIAPRTAGRLRMDKSSSPGGYLSVHGLHAWNSDDIVGYLEVATDEALDTLGQELRLLMLAGRRMSGLADVDAGLLPGWHSRSRAWWGDHEGPSATLLCMGICDAAGIVRGNQVPFIETFESTPRATQVVYVPDHPVLPCAPVLLDQFLRTPAQNQAIAADLGAALSGGRVTATSDDWLFAGALLSWLERSPLRDTYDVVTPTGLRHLGPPSAILLSLSSEAPSILRHRKLGYALQMLRHRQTSAGPAIRAWLASEFDTIKRSIGDIRRDYRLLIETVAKQTGAKIFILNRMSTSGYEDIVSYSPFDAPMSDTLENIAAKELNLMLHDLAEECDISIIDVDALAAEIGGAEHLPDGIHHSAAMQAVLRSAIFSAWDFPLQSASLAVK
jgi:hypothetical protein